MALIKCCKGCKDRHPACHDSCYKYLTEKRENQEAMEKYRKDNAGNNQLKQMYSFKKEKRMRRYKNDIW